MKKTSGICTLKRLFIFVITIIMSLSVMACGSDDDSDSNVKVVLTTGFEKDELFRIESISCTVPEMMVYLTNIQNQYEAVYGEQIWDVEVDGETLEENVKDIALARIAQIKTMDLMAAQYGVSLGTDEQALAQAAAETYFSSLNEEEIAQMGVDEALIENLYEEYALAENVYEYLIQDIHPEISDDEARTITVQQILIKTYALDGTGKKIEYTQNAKDKAYQTAEEAWELAVAGEDFDDLIRQYSEDEKSTYSFGQENTDSPFVKAAFNLGTGEISDIVETEYGYHIIKCISTFDREETDNNKLKIVEQRRKEAFEKEYDAFAETLTRRLNDELWESIHFLHDDAVVTADFFDVYNDYFTDD